jgi:S1-C subfamily serine protease
MILNSNGLVLTNNHVIDGATSVRVTLVETGRTYPATVVGYDATDDVALLQLQGASGLKPISVGNSNQVSLGTRVLALGNAQGKGGLPSAAQGIINAKNRTITASDSGSGATETLHGMFQTNAQIQQGDSGGPLVNSAGQVIGMDTAANTSSSDSFSTSGTVIGFAIPINKALTIANEIANNQASSTVHIGQTAFIGVAVADISRASSCVQGSGSGFGGAGGGYTAPVSSGAVVCQALPGTAAASAGLTAGDVITAVNGQSVSSEAALTTITAQFKVGQTASIAYVDSNGAKHTTALTLTAGPAK